MTRVGHLSRSGDIPEYWGSRVPPLNCGGLVSPTRRKLGEMSKAARVITRWVVLLAVASLSAGCGSSSSPRAGYGIDYPSARTISAQHNAVHAHEGRYTARQVQAILAQFGLTPIVSHHNTPGHVFMYERFRNSPGSLSVEVETDGLLPAREVGRHERLRPQGYYALRKNVVITSWGTGLKPAARAITSLLQ